MNEREKANMLDTLAVFGGTQGGMVLGLQSLIFPNMLQASRFVDYHKLSTIAWIEDKGGRTPATFNEVVTIQVDTKR